MGTSVLGHIHAQFQIAGIQEFKEYSSYHSSNEYNISHKEQECGLKQDGHPDFLMPAKCNYIWV